MAPLSASQLRRTRRHLWKSLGNIDIAQLWNEYEMDYYYKILYSYNNKEYEYKEMF